MWQKATATAEGALLVPEDISLGDGEVDLDVGEEELAAKEEEEEEESYQEPPTVSSDDSLEDEEMDSSLEIDIDDQDKDEERSISPPNESIEVQELKNAPTQKEEGSASLIDHDIEKKELLSAPEVQETAVEEETNKSKGIKVPANITGSQLKQSASISFIPIKPSSEKIKRREKANTTAQEKGRPKTNKKGGISRSTSIANFRRGITPLQLVKKQEEEKRKKRISIMSDSPPVTLKELAEEKINPLKLSNKEKEKDAKKRKKLLKQYRTALSCNASLISVQAEKALKSREDTITKGKNMSGAIMQYGQLIKGYDNNSLLFHSLTQSAEFMDIMVELQASWCRNLTRRVIQPIKILQNVADNKNSEITSSHIADCSNSLIGFAGVYLNFFKVGHKNMSMLYEQIMEYRTVVAFDKQNHNSFEVGKRCTIPLHMVSMSGNGMKKGAIRHNWKARWFVLYYNHLLYFSSHAESILRGHISLENAIVSVNTSHRKYPNVLNILSNQRNYVISFDTEQELQTWMDLIQASITKHPAVSVQRAQICLVEPKVVLGPSSDKNYKPPSSLDGFLREDMFSRYWREFRAKDPNLMNWVVQDSNLLDLISYSLMFVPDVTQDELNMLENSIAKAAEVPEKQGGKLRRTLSTFGTKIRKENLTPNIEELKRSNNALLFKTANSAFTILVSSEFLAHAFVCCESAMIKLFNFMKDERPPVQARRFHAFTELIISLLRHKSEEVFGFLAAREELIAQLLYHIENEHCLRLLVGLWSYPQSEEKVNVLNQLGVMAVRHYFEPSVTEQEYDHLTIFIRELIRRHRLLTMQPETVMILSKMKEISSTIYASGLQMGTIDLEEGLDLYSPRNEQSTEKKKKTPKKTEESNGDLSSGTDNDIDDSNSSKGSKETKKEAAEDVFTKVRPRRQSEVRRDWVDISWNNFEEGTEENQVREEEMVNGESEEKGGAPNKPLPSVPVPRKPVNREHLNIRAPGYLESKTAPFMTAIKNRNTIRILVSYALQYENQQRSERSTELLIGMLKINRSKESYQQDMNPIDEDVIQKAPHVVITELVSKFHFMAQILKLPSSKLSTSMPPLGPFKYNLVRLIRYVIDCGFRFVDRNLIESKLLYRCVCLVFAYPRHSILLSTMNELFTIVYTRTIHEELGTKLIKKYKFTQKLMEAVTHSNSLAIPLPIASYMINLANTMSANQTAQKILRKNTEWIEFLVDEVLPPLVLQHSDTVEIPQRDQDKQKMEEEKWARRWEEFNFLYSV